jgi:hypothetical protein
MFDYHEKNKGHKNVLLFCFPWSKLRVFQKWEETLEKEKGIGKNEYEWNEWNE